MNTIIIRIAPLSILLVGTLTIAAPPEQCHIDFEGLPAGTVVTELAAGQGISGCSTGQVIGVTSQNSLFGSEAAIVFDSSCPEASDPCGPDDDLGTPHQDFGGPGTGSGGAMGSPFQNDTALHNMLILAENKTDADNDGLVDVPNDADVPGETNFDFSGFGPNGVTIDAVTLMDIELAENETPAEVTLVRKSGPPAVFAQLDTGDNGVATIEGIGIDQVVAMNVSVKGSSALAAISFNAPETIRACWATFGGFDSAFAGPEGQKIASFGGNVGPPPSGHLNIVKHETGQHLRIADVAVESCIRDENICAASGSNSPGQPGGKKGFDINVLNFVGTGDLDGTSVAVSGRLVDCGEPAGKKGNDPDFFEVLVNGSVFVGDVLGGGNIQLHPPVGNQ
jgi:hypothetical protein